MDKRNYTVKLLVGADFMTLTIKGTSIQASPVGNILIYDGDEIVAIAPSTALVY